MNTLKNIFKDKNNRIYIIMGMSICITIIIVLCFVLFRAKHNKVIINGVNISRVFEKDKIGVYIDGEVNNPGYIQIPKGKDLEYAINKVEGVTKEADIENINIKQILKNGEKIIIPKKRRIDYDKDIEKEEIQNKKININSATKEELTMLEGIGEKTAENILNYRKENTFDSIEEVMEVKGIGKGKYEKIKDDICI